MQRFVSDQQADRVLPAARPPGEAGPRPEEAGQAAAVHASGLFGTFPPSLKKNN